MEMIDLKGCKAVKVETDAFAPFVQAGQIVIFSETASVKEDDFVYLPMPTKEWLTFCRVIKIAGIAIALASLAKQDNSEVTQGVVQGVIGDTGMLFVHRIMAVATYYEEK